MIIHLFNSSSVSGPERLVLPPLSALREQFMVINLLEDRIPSLQRTDPLGEFARSLGLAYESIRVKGRWDRSAMNTLRSLLESKAPALVHAHDVKASAYLLRAKGRRRIPFASTHHGVHGRPGVITRLYERLYRHFFLNSFDRVMTVSSADHAILLDSGVHGSRLRLHLNGADGSAVSLEQRAQASKEIRSAWIPHEPARDRLFLFGAVGRLSAEKDHSRLLHILARLHQPRGRDWRCLMFGAGPLEESLRRQARELGLEKQVVWMGFRKDVGRELAGLDLLLSFSKAEGLPISLIEAGWAGTPVMATWVGGVKDLIPDALHGIPVPADEHVSETAHRLRTILLSANLAGLQDLGKTFQARVMEKFTGGLWMNRLKAIYLELKVRLNSPAWTGAARSAAVGRSIVGAN